MKIGLITTHAEAARILRDAGLSVPAIPPGCNTVRQHFTTADGRPAVAVNQTGFIPTAADNEEECNGCTVAICLDDPPPADAAGQLDHWLTEFLTE